MTMLQTYYDKPSTEGLCDVFRSKGFAAQWKIAGPGRPDVAMQSLPPFLRTLLVTDGTVTKSLEAYYWEPISVSGVTQRVTAAEAGIDWLHIKQGEQVLARYVQLRGAHTERCYANAFSIIRLELIPAELRAKLLDGSIGIGELIRNCGLETYRELMELGMTDDFSLGGEYGDAREECVYRTYRITLNNQPAMLVTECFPVQPFAL